jgi:hypothetical protein
MQSRYPSLTLQTRHTPSTNTTTAARHSGTSSASAHTTSSAITAVDNSAVSGSYQRKIILLKDPPGYEQGGNESQRQRLREMYTFVLSFQCPVVMVRSDVSGRDDFQFAAEGCLPYYIRQK